MSNRSIEMSPELHRYLIDQSLREHPVLWRLRHETAQMEQANMQIAPEQGQFMALLAKLMGAERYLEIGVFTGYSSLAVALALPESGKVTACDIDESYTDIAIRYWKEAGMAERIDLHLGAAVETLDRLIAADRKDSYDFAFIDADKVNYQAYFDRCLELVRPGGLIAVDNVLWNGSVLDRDKDDADTVAIRDFNRTLHGDERVDISMVPIADGLTLARKR